DAINVLNLDGTMNDNAGPHYKGMASLECRSAILEELESEGLLDKTEPYSHSIGHCQRCKTAVEPIISKQWFVKMKPLASPAIEAVKTGQIKVVPEKFTKVYLNWMDNIRDWCISRQLWWGHRIPVWYCNECSEMTVQVDDPSDCEKCQSAEIVQDPDVLDTWFSSALWTHSTLGWPEETEDLRYFYPTSVMETGYDILFFWVARMIMMGMENLGQTPFHTVYLHGLIRDEAGEKMSKVKGNVLNPLDAIETYGTDALRLALTIGTAPGNDSRLSRGKLEASRNFANKLWNAARFVISTMETDKLQSWDSPQPNSLSVEDRWILSRLNRVTGKVNELLEKFLIGEAEQELHDFLWGEYCDWYIEMAKIRLREDTEEVSPVPVLVHVLERVLRLLHPFMPFITEEIWQSLTQHLPDRDGLSESIMIAPYPTPDKRAIDNEAEDFMAKLISLVRSVRDVRADFKIEPTKYVDLVVDAGEHKYLIEFKAKAINALAKAKIKQVVSEATQLQQYKNAVPIQELVTVPIVLEGMEAMVLLDRRIDVQIQKRRFKEGIEGSKQQITRLTNMLANEEFLTRAPAQVVERERRKLEKLKEKEQKLRERLAQLR
ncbi:MAG: valine--tRNA ligase, partial [Dehalococcoidia bacterium]